MTEKEVKKMGNDEGYGYVALVAFLAGIVIGMVFDLALVAWAGKNFAISTPIENLEPGKVYEVKGLTRDAQNCFLLLKADNEIKFYKLPSADVPAELEAGDGLVQLSTGLKRLPQEFKK